MDAGLFRSEEFYAQVKAGIVADQKKKIEWDAACE